MTREEAQREYIRDNYGTCTRKPKCYCAKMGWLGTGCHTWEPIPDEEVNRMMQYMEKDTPKIE